VICAIRKRDGFTLPITGSSVQKTRGDYLNTQIEVFMALNRFTRHSIPSLSFSSTDLAPLQDPEAGTKGLGID